MIKRNQCILLTAAASLLWSTGGTLIKLISWNGFIVAGLRSIVAAITVAIISHTFTLRLSPKQWFAAAAYAASVILITFANKYTTAANAVLLTYTSPIYTAIGASVFLKERLHKSDIISIAVILAGLIFFVANGLTTGNFFGDAIALAAGIVYAIMILLLRSEKDGNPFICVIWGGIIAFSVTLPFMRKVEFIPQNIILVIIMGVFQLGISYAMYVYALKYISALESNILTVLEPIFSPMWAFLFVNRELPDTSAVVGGIIIIIGVLIKEIRPVKSGKEVK